MLRGESCVLNLVPVSPRSCISDNLRSPSSFRNRLGGLDRKTTRHLDQECVKQLASMLPDSNVYVMFKHLKDAQLILYPDAGHGALLQ